MKRLLFVLALGALLAGCSPQESPPPAANQQADKGAAATPGPNGRPAAPPLPPGLGGAGAPAPGGK